MESLYSALLGAGVPSLACIVLCWLVWRQLTADAAARKRLEEKVSCLETEKISKIESRLDTHIKDDKSQELLTEMRQYVCHFYFSFRLPDARRTTDA